MSFVPERGGNAGCRFTSRWAIAAPSNVTPSAPYWSVTAPETSSKLRVINSTKTDVAGEIGPDVTGAVSGPASGSEQATITDRLNRAPAIEHPRVASGTLMVTFLLSSVYV